MLVNGEHYRTIWEKRDGGSPKSTSADGSATRPSIIQIIDQRNLPHEVVIEDLTTVEDFARAIQQMHLRGAGVIGAAAAYGMYVGALSADRGDFSADLDRAAARLRSTRPTASNLGRAVDMALDAVAKAGSIDDRVDAALSVARAVTDEDADFARRIGEHGVGLLEAISKRKGGQPVNVLTHCNAGWLAFVDYGSATAPIYEAQARGIDVHVWVDETRPRNQGARLTAWELGQQGVAHTVIVDNVGGHLMQHGLVDLVIVGTDRTTRTGDVANKIGTYLKALAARDNDVPFYVALPSTTVDWTMRDGVKEIPIEQRDGDEVTHIQGFAEGRVRSVRLTPESSPACNYAFDVTPSRLVTGLITERGVCEASERGLVKLYPERG